MQIKKAMKFALMKVHTSGSVSEPLNSYHLQLCQHIFSDGHHHRVECPAAFSNCTETTTLWQRQSRKHRHWEKKSWHNLA